MLLARGQTTGGANREVHIVFTAPTRDAVDEFVRIAEGLGAEADPRGDGWGHAWPK